MAQAEDYHIVHVHCTGQYIWWVRLSLVGQPSYIQVACRTATLETCADLLRAASAMTRCCCVANCCSKSRLAFLTRFSKLRRGLPVRFNRFLHEPEAHVLLH